MDRPNSVYVSREPKIPRPRNGEHTSFQFLLTANAAQAFILYRQHQQAGVVRSHPGLPNPAISKIIGEQWSHLPEEEKGQVESACGSKSKSFVSNKLALY